MARPLAAQVAQLTNPEKAAVVLLAMGPELSSQILAKMQREDVQKVTAEIASLKEVPKEVQDEILRKLAEEIGKGGAAVAGGVDAARELLTRAFGEEQARELMAKLDEARSTRSFAALNRMDPAQIVSVIKNEHPQAIAVLLCHLSQPQAAAVLAGLPPELQGDVVYRMATMGQIPSDVMQEMKRLLEERLSSTVQEGYVVAGGIQRAADVLNKIDRSVERRIMDALEMTEPDLAQEIKRHMFVFDDLATLDDRAIQRILKEVETKDLALALKAAGDEVREKILGNMSQRAAAMIEEEIDVMGPVRLKDVQQAQQAIAAIATRLEAEGEIVIGGRGGEGEILV